MDELGLYFKAPLDAGLAKKKLKSVKAVRNQKERLTVAFFVSSSGFKICKPVVIRKSKVTRCFRKLHNPSKSYGMQYFRNKKAWITTESWFRFLPP